MNSIEIENIVEKAKQLDPDDPLRRGILECVADYRLHPTKTNEKRIEERARKLKY